MEPLKQTYHYLESYHAARHCPPTIREIGEAMGITFGQARYRLVKMEALGWIVRDGRRQSIVLNGMG